LRSHEAMDTSRLFTATSLGSGAVGDRIVARLRIAIGRRGRTKCLRYGEWAAPRWARA
jgi:hypothetical protein